jgi:hypothetical protein
LIEASTPIKIESLLHNVEKNKLSNPTTILGTPVPVEVVLENFLFTRPSVSNITEGKLPKCFK